MQPLTSEHTQQVFDQLTTYWESDSDSAAERKALANSINSKVFGSLGLTINNYSFGTIIGLRSYCSPLKNNISKIDALSKIVENSHFIKWIKLILNLSIFFTKEDKEQLNLLWEMTSDKNETQEIVDSLKSWPNNKSAMEFLFRFMLDLIVGGSKKTLRNCPQLENYISNTIHYHNPRKEVSFPPRSTGGNTSALSHCSEFSVPQSTPQWHYVRSATLVQIKQTQKPSLTSYDLAPPKEKNLEDAQNFLRLAQKKAGTYHPLCLFTPATQNKLRSVGNAIEALEQAIIELQSTIRDTGELSHTPNSTTYHAVLDLEKALNQPRFFTECKTGIKLREKANYVKRLSSSNSC